MQDHYKILFKILFLKHYPKFHYTFLAIRYTLPKIYIYLVSPEYLLYTLIFRSIMHKDITF